MEPISDDELQYVRDYLTRCVEWGFKNIDMDRQRFERIIARLDAAESRAAELQREVERLQASLRPVCSLPVEVVAEQDAIAGLTGGEG